jgi:hypothetical protein
MLTQCARLRKRKSKRHKLQSLVLLPSYLFVGRQKTVIPLTDTLYGRPSIKDGGSRPHRDAVTCRIFIQLTTDEIRSFVNYWLGNLNLQLHGD